MPERKLKKKCETYGAMIGGVIGMGIYTVTIRNIEWLWDINKILIVGFFCGLTAWIGMSIGRTHYEKKYRIDMEEEEQTDGPATEDD